MGRQINKNVFFNLKNTEKNRLKARGFRVGFLNRKRFYVEYCMKFKIFKKVKPFRKRSGCGNKQTILS